MTDRDKIRKIIRREMKKIYGQKPCMKKKQPFDFCFSQAKFDTLMDIDRELGLGAFYKLPKGKK